MRVVVTGASGNVGTSLLRLLAADSRVDSILGLARRRPAVTFEKTTWAVADVSTADLRPHFEEADAVVHLAWLIQPSHDLPTLRRVNVEGSRNVFAAAARAHVPTLVYASSIGAYSPAPKDRRIDETWPTQGVRTSFYSRHKAEVERMLDSFESENPSLRSVRMRPALIFKREAGSEVRRLFAGPLLPSFLLRRYLIPFVPGAGRLVFQAVHTDDVAEAYRLAVVGDARGAFNLAAEPVLTPDELGRALGARPVPLPEKALRMATELSWRLHLQPTPPGWVDLALSSPLMDVTRARRTLGWVPRWSSSDALLDLLSGIRDGAGIGTPPLAPATGGPLRLRELLSGVGSRP